MIGITKSAQGLGVIEFPGFGYVSKDKCYFSNWVNFREFAKGYRILLFDWIKSKISHWNLINISFFFNLYIAITCNCHVRNFVCPFKKEIFKISSINDSAWLFGDPHINTLDGHQYTFNGYDEYVLLRINTTDKQFELQARTDLAERANGTTINATIFSAFAARDDTGAFVQVELSRHKDS